MTRISLTVALASLFSLALAQTPPTPPPAEPSPAEQCRQLIDAALHDKNPDTRLQAVVALSLSVAKQPWTGMVAGMLDDKDVQVRVAVVATLLDLRGADANTALHKALDDEIPEVSFAAARALYGLKDPAGKEALLSVLAGETKTSSGFVTRQKRDAIRMLHTPRTLFLFSLRLGAGFVPVPGLGMGVSSMETLLFDPTLSGRASAALLLGREKDAGTLQALKDALSDNTWSVRAAAVHSIALRNDPAQKSTVFPLLLDKSQGVRLRAAVTWLRLDSIGHGAKAPAPHAPAPPKKG
ncbi:MAG: HEAT repeat domain-containing protein [Bryobacteraceae bacterium]